MRIIFAGEPKSGKSTLLEWVKRQLDQCGIKSEVALQENSVHALDVSISDEKLSELRNV